MYRLLPFIAAVESVLPVNIPIEIWALILRNLDPTSLLSTIKTDSFLMSVAKGDPVLRKRVANQMENQKVKRREEFLNPGLLMQIDRNGPSNMFAKNQSNNKKVRVLPMTGEENLPGFFDQPYQKRNGGGKTTKKQKKTTEHFARKPMRF